MPSLKKLLIVLLFGLFASRPFAAGLPTLGESFSGYSSLEEEYRLGQAWLRLLKGNTQLVDDPLLQDYLESLLFRLASHSELPDKRLSLAILRNPALNAFAVPGGIVGVNGGLFLHAREEDEMASVLAHELAHLSQRHYAQNLEEQRKQLPLQLAAMLGGLILAAASDAKDGAAAIAAGQAATIQQQLSFSRQNEQEADRIGMQTLYQAGYAPQAMPQMFKRMQRSTRFLGEKPPEFLLTHPITESRVADSENRAAQFPAIKSPPDDTYELMKVRAQLALIKDPRQLQEHFRQQLSKSRDSASLYGFALSATASNALEEAGKALSELQARHPNSIPVQVAAAEWLIASQRSDEAAERLKQYLALSPDNRPLARLYAEALANVGQYDKAIRLLENQVQRHRADQFLWRQLADINGQAKNRLGIHEARAEYYLLTAQVDDAVKHLQFALKIPNLTEQARLRLQTRIDEAHTIKKSLNF